MKTSLQIAKDVLIQEAKAIQDLLPFIDDEFEKCIHEIIACKGRVVCTGIGKSAIIAAKLVATFNSTGTPALFMHAADAIHGDLGMIQPTDIVICLSKSGNTSEIKVLIPLLKRTSSKLIALVSNKNSYLAQHADYTIYVPVEQEACPHNLAPTTSTTAMLAMGDALAICLLEARNFTSNDFARLHPGGTLGKKLYLRVDDIYKQNQLPIVDEQAKLETIIIEITSKRLGATAVVNNKRNSIGIITDGDLRRMLKKTSSSLDLKNIEAHQIMTKNPKTIQYDELAIDALDIMKKNNITQLMVLKKDEVVGFIHLHDLLQEGLV